MVNNNLFDVKALSGRVSSLSDQLKTARQGWEYQGNNGYLNSYAWQDQRTPLQNDLEKTQAELGVAEQYQSDLMSSNAAANNRLNMGALASSRRRAGGSTFRRPRSGVSANDLAPNLGVANAKSLAETRRAKALADVAARQGAQTNQPDYSTAPSFSLGPTFTRYY